MEGHWMIQPAFSIRIYVLTKKDDFFGAVIDQMADFLIQLVGFSRFFSSPGEGNNAKSTKLVATFNNVNKGAGTQFFWKLA